MGDQDRPGPSPGPSSGHAGELDASGEGTSSGGVDAGKDLSRREVLASVPKLAATMALSGQAGQAEAYYNILFLRGRAKGSTLFGWGANDTNGARLGLGDNVFRSSPTQVGTLSTWVYARNTRYFSMGLRSDGTIWGVGDNAQGQLGTNSTTATNTFVQMGTLSTWTALTTGDSFSLAIRSDGTLWSWGQGGNGGLGNNSIVNRSNPVQVGTVSTWKTFGADATAFAIRTDGTLWAWGANSVGEIGNGNRNNQSVPVQIGTLSNWKQVSINWSTVIGLRTDGTLWAWGRDTLGSLGRNQDGVKYSSPVQIGSLSTWAQVSAGFVHSAAVRTDGTLWTWGWNGDGLLGNNSNINRSSPVQVGNLSIWAAVEANTLYYTGTTHAIRTDGTMWAWGRDQHIGNNAAVSRSSPVQIGSLSSWTSVSAGWGTVFAFR